MINPIDRFTLILTIITIAFFLIIVLIGAAFWPW